jgi:uncharacterized lipoprotein YmbA
MKKLLAIVSFILLSGCGAQHAHNDSFYSPQKQAINAQINGAAIAQQQYQTGLQSQSTYFRSANFQMLPNTIGN